MAVFGESCRCVGSVAWGLVASQIMWDMSLWCCSESGQVVTGRGAADGESSPVFSSLCCSVLPRGPVRPTQHHFLTKLVDIIKRKSYTHNYVLEKWFNVYYSEGKRINEVFLIVLMLIVIVILSPCLSSSGRYHHKSSSRRRTVVRGVRNSAKLIFNQFISLAAWWQ